MKPLLLEIDGFNSFQTREIIDFKKLTKLNLFGIFGETGTGKTTILDAIIYALYEKTPRDNDIININKDLAYVKYVFSIKGKNQGTYAIERTLKRNKTKTTKQRLTKLNNENEPIILAEKKTEVDEKIKEIIGLDFLDFTKTVVLPQGQFSAFLNEKNMKRKEILERIFNLKKYGDDLNLKIKGCKDKYQNVEKEIKFKLDNYKDISKENINLLENEKKEIKANIVTKEKEFSILEKINVEYTILTEFKDRLNTAKKQLEDLEKYSLKMEDMKNKVEALEKIKDIKSEIEFLVKNKDLKENLELENKTLEAMISIIQKKLETLKEEKKDLTLKLEIIDSSLKSKAYESKNLILEINKLNSEKNKILKKINEKTSKLINSQKKEPTLLETGKKLEEQYKKLSKEIFNNMERDNLENAVKILQKKFIETKICPVCNRPMDQHFDLSSLEVKKEEFNNMAALKKLEEIKNTHLDVEKELSITVNNIENYKEELKILNLESQENLKLLSEKEHTLKASFNEIEKILRENNIFQNISIENFIENIDKTSLEFSTKLKKINLNLEDLEKEKEVKNITFAKNKEKENYLNENLTNSHKVISNFQKKYENSQEENIFLKNLNLEKILILYRELDKLEDKKKKIENYRNLLNNAKIKFSSCEKQYMEKEIKTRELLENRNFSKEIYENEKNSLNEMRKKLGFIENNLNIQKESLEKKESLLKEEKKNTKVLDEIYEIEKLFKGKAFINFLAKYQLSYICKTASKILGEISNSVFELKIDENGDFIIIDNMNMGKERQVNSLSGGETFLVSLALSLALSSNIQLKGNAPLEFFFMDEGFGTLDNVSLDMALNSIAKIKNPNLSVGIISHIDKIKEFVPVKLEIKKINNISKTFINIG